MNQQIYSRRMVPFAALAVVALLCASGPAHAAVPCAWEPNFGGVVLSGDDSTATVNLGITFPFLGSNYTTAFISTNGFLTFVSNAGAGCCDADVTSFLNGPPRISVAWADQVMSISQSNFPNRVVFTWQGNEFSGTNPHRWQVQLETNGRVTMGYDLLPPEAGGGGHRHHGLIGVTNGQGSANPGEVNFSSAPPLSTSCNGTVYEFFARGPNGATGPDADPWDMESNSLVYTPDGCGGWNVTNCSSPNCPGENWDGNVTGWAGTCERINNPFDPESCSQNLDGGLFQSAPFSEHLFAHGSCFSPPFDGAAAAMTKTFALANNTYVLKYKVRHTTELYNFCGGGTGGDSSIFVNGVQVGGASGCGVGGSCSTCLADWSTRQGCFTATTGSTTLKLFTNGGDCSNVNGWFDDITMCPAAPLTITAPANITRECGQATDPSVTGQPTVSSPDCTFTTAFSDVTTGTCPRTITRTWTVTDEAGRTATAVQIITVQDTVPPVFTSALPGNITISCSTALPAAPTVTASDTCMTPTVSLVTSALQGTQCNGTITRTWTATDGCNAITHVQTITVMDNVAPVFTSALPGNTTISCSTALPAAPTVTASDNCTGATVTLVTSPLQGNQCNGTITRTWTATDGCNNTVTHVQTITVMDNVNPVFTSALPGNITISCSTALPAAPTVTASDNCTTPTVTLATSPLQGTECNGTITRTWTATDGCNSITHVQTITVIDNVNPVFTSALPGNTTVSCSTALPAPPTVTASDNCTGATVTLVTSPLQGTQCNGTITRTWTATDGCNNAITHVQTIAVVDDVDPVFTSALPGNITIACSTALPPAPTVTASDNCTGAAVTLVTSPLQGTQCNGTITRTWTATDGCNNAITHVQTIAVVDDVDPVFTSALPGNITIACSTALPPAPTVTASDNCTGATVTLVTSPLQGTQCNGTITRTWTATDGCNNAITHVQTIAVVDNVDPVFTSPLPGDITIDCSTVLSAPPTVTASDNCTGATVVLVESPLTGSECDGVITRTWTATDGCNNTTTHVQTITVHDDVAPVPMGVLEPAMALPPRSVTSACSAPVSRVFRVLCETSDNCDPMPSLSAQLLATQSEVSPGGVCTSVVEAVDVACDSLVEIRLLASPCPADGPASARPAASVNSDGVVVVSGESVVLEVTSTDNCGNSATDTFDPATEPSTLCDEVLVDGTCCPAIGQPASDCDNPCGGNLYEGTPVPAEGQSRWVGPGGDAQQR